MSEPGNIPRRRSFNRLSSARGRSRDADDRSVGDKSARSTGTARRRRSRSPLRSVTKSSRSIVGRLAKIGGKKTKKDKTFEAAAAALGYDDDDEVASKPSTASNPAVAEPDVAGGKKAPTPKEAAAPELDDEETVYGVVIEKQPSKSKSDDSKKSESSPKQVAEKVKEEAVAPAPAPAPEPTPVPVKEEPAKTTKKESKKDAKKAAKEAKKEAAKKEKEAAAAAAAKAKASPQIKDPSSKKEEVKSPAPAPAPAAAPVPIPTIAPGSAIQIILLLMDPASRRFELLQLEFDSTRALVSDVLAQIPLSATVESMRTQKYRAVCDRKGAEMDNASKLVGFTHGKEGEVILAIPQEMSSRECAKLARPILSDPNVVAMLNPASAAALAPVKEEKKKDAPAETEVKSRAAPALDEASKDSKPTSGGPSVLSILVAVVAVAAGTYMLNDAITKPLGPGDRLRPGSYVSKCGFMGFVPPVVLTTLSDLAEEHLPDHAGLVPSVCESAGIEMGNDGVLRKYSYAGDVAGGEVTWEIAGGVCPEEGDEACVPGLVVEEDGRLTIGGQAAKIPTIKEEMEPWPFVIDPTKAGSKWW